MENYPQGIDKILLWVYTHNRKVANNKKPIKLCQDMTEQALWAKARQPAGEEAYAAVALAREEFSAEGLAGFGALAHICQR